MPWDRRRRKSQHPDFWSLILAMPLLMVIGYGLARILFNVFNNIRDAMFAAVGQHAVRGLANRAFVHLHNL